LRALRPLAASLAIVAACTEHDPEVDRVGLHDVPDSGSACNLESDPSAELPCAVEAVLKDKCQRCHQSPTKNGAPFPLLVWNDLLYDYGGPAYEAMYRAVKLDFMPFCNDGSCTAEVVAKLEGGPGEPLTAEQKKTLLDYLSCPEPRYGQSCP